MTNSVGNGPDMQALQPFYFCSSCEHRHYVKKKIVSVRSLSGLQVERQTCAWASCGCKNMVEGCPNCLNIADWASSSSGYTCRHCHITIRKESPLAEWVGLEMKWVAATSMPPWSRNG